MDDQKLIITNDSDGKTFMINQNNYFIVRLVENPTTGFQWELERIHDNILSLEQETFIQPVDEGMGASGFKEYLFYAKSPGKQYIKFKNWRAWEGEESAIDNFHIIIEVIK
ncbi:MAG: protease inhibitor I42 family protein [Ignavibacteriales bacterium]|nr:protease inhibitor I42 family protein [Ignavibacteriota bacterium]MCB9250754.1 protease inhibitor I42 family protein [Ignavibacteriales bacterium]